MPTVINIPSNEEYSSFEKAIVDEETRQGLLALYRSMPKLSTYLRKSTETHWRAINAMILDGKLKPFRYDWSQYKVCDVGVIEKELPNTLLTELYAYGIESTVRLPAYYEKGMLVDVAYSTNHMDTDVIHVLDIVSKDNTDKYYHCNVISVQS